eukprot:4054985-Amphidinium_carterae.1
MSIIKKLRKSRNRNNNWTIFLPKFWTARAQPQPRMHDGQPRDQFPAWHVSSSLLAFHGLASSPLESMTDGVGRMLNHTLMRPHHKLSNKKTGLLEEVGPCPLLASDAHASRRRPIPRARSPGKSQPPESMSSFDPVWL